MKSTLYGLAAVVLFAAAPVLAETGTTTIHTSDGKTVTITGTVTEYVPNKTIVIRDSGQKVMTYTLGPNVVVPSDVVVGKTVTLYPATAGGNVIQKVVTTKVNEQGNLETTTRSTETLADGSTITTTGTVVEFVPNKTLVIRNPENRVITYSLQPGVAIPADVAVGKTITVYANPGTTGTGSASVTRVTTVASDGSTKTTTKTSETDALGNTTTTEEVTVEGVVSGYTASKTVTVKSTDGTSYTYTIDRASAIPTDLAIGKRVVLRVAPVGEQRIVRKITYYTTQ